jgi:modulator of FtsH protease HflC
MKRNTIILVTGSLVVLILGLWLCAFQVRTTEVAVVTLFGKPSRDITQPGLYWKWPPPINVVHKFDQRAQNLEDKFTEDLTADGNNLLTSVYVGWRISDPKLFFPKFVGSVTRAEENLSGVVRSAKAAIVGKHPLSDFVSADSDGSKFAAIEAEILAAVQGQVHANQYGVEIEFLGFKKLGLPESVSTSVFERMTSERQVLINAAQYDGEAQAQKIRSDADRRAAEVIAAARGQALQIQGQGEAEAAKYLATFQQNPELANFLFRLNALESVLRERATLIFDQQTMPFDLFKGGIPTNRFK